MREPLILSRREALILAAGGVAVRLYAAATDFWNKKPPSEWTAEDIDRLVTNSPWAKEVTAEYSGEEQPVSDQGGRSSGPVWGEGGSGGPGGQRGGGIGGLGIPGIGLPRRGSRTPGGSTPRRRTGASPYKGTVLWESAQPVQDAIKTPLSDTFANHYAISVNGIPLLKTGDSADSGEEDFESVKRFSILQPKGKAEAQAAIVKREISNGSVLLFGFPRDAVKIGPDDKEILFQTRFGGLVVKARFNLKDMTYKGQLAL